MNNKKQSTKAHLILTFFNCRFLLKISNLTSINIKIKYKNLFKTKRVMLYKQSNQASISSQYSSRQLFYSSQLVVNKTVWLYECKHKSTRKIRCI